MTDMEKKVMVRLCAKILSETDLYDTDIEVRNLIDWICVSEQIKSNNNEIRSIHRDELFQSGSAAPGEVKEQPSV